MSGPVSNTLTCLKVFGDWVLNLICADRQITEEDAGEQKYVHRDRLKPTLTLMVPHAAKLAELMAELRKKTEEKVCAPVRRVVTLI